MILFQTRFFTLMGRSYSLILFLMLISAFSLAAFDWGVQLNQSAGAEGVGNEKDDFIKAYSGTIIPWFSTPPVSENNTWKLYLSAGATVQYINNSVFFIPELLRTELTWHIGTIGELKFGRIPYADPLGFIAVGLFDGARYSLQSNLGVISASVMYTGLLYKKSADIAMTDEDEASYNKAFEIANFTDTYLAPRRLIAALDWDNPYLAQGFRLRASLIGQFDFSGNDKLSPESALYHSQYLAIKASIPINSFIFGLGGCLELAEKSDEKELSLVGEFEAGWRLPTPIKDILTLTGRFSSGAKSGPNSSLSAFVPITTVYQGDALQAKFSGLSMIRLEYTAQLHETFSFNIASSYFILSDLKTYKGFPMEKKGNFLGNELSGQITWSVFSDLQFCLVGGVFLPSMGNSGSANTPLWRMELNVLLAVF